jgi:peptidyl-prolyl cis-trans isomerase C
MRGFIRYGLIAALGMSLLSLTGMVTGSGDDVLAVVGDMKITAADLQKKIEEIPSYARTNFLTVEGRLKLLDRIVKTELLKRAAIDAEYESRPEIKAMLDEARERILTSEYFKNEMSEPDGPAEADMLAYYNAHKEEYKTDKSAEVSQILLNSEDEAKAVLKKIVSGKMSFEEAVLAESKDDQSKSNGGSLGKVREGGFVKGIGRSAEFDEAVFGLKEGELSKPVKTRKGWHIFRMDASVKGGYRSFADVKDQISDELLVSEEEIEAEYRAKPNDYKTRARRKIKHIQVATEDDAEDVYKALKGGADFDSMVESRSTDTASIKQKGSLGYLYEEGYVRGIGKDPEFEKMVFGLEESAFSKPIKTKKGWHIVLVEEKTDESKKPLADVRVQIKNKLIRDKKESGVDKRFDQLRQKYKCRVYEDRVGNLSTTQ